MARNNDLGKAKVAKADEFYTQKVDIENELHYYADYFEGKTVYCNCDDPKESEFWQFFVRNFKPWKLKKLIATHYEPDENTCSYKLELTADTVNSEPIKTPLSCNGDFRSDECIEILKEADVVVTNPPFSLWREYVAQLVEYNKHFVIIGNINAITYKEIFPLLKDNKMWLGQSIHSGDRAFYVPDDYPLKASGCGIDETGRKYVRVKGVRWFTNIDIPQRHTKLDLRGVYYSSDIYSKYDNYDAIHIEKVADIPCDYEGEMGVPINFLDSYNPEQFEILGLTSLAETMPTPVQLGKEFIEKYRAAGGTGHYSANMYKVAYFDKNGKAKVPYGRILVKNKHPQERTNKNEN